MRKMLVVLSLITVSLTATACSSADGEKNNTPMFFRNLNKFKAVNVEDYGVREWYAPFWITEYYFNINNKYKVACSGPSNSDTAYRPVRCKGWLPGMNGSASMHVNTPTTLLYSPSDTADGSASTSIDFNIPQDPTSNSKKILPVGKKIFFAPSAKWDESDPSYSTTCVVPNQDSFGCLGSDKHGFYVDNEGTHTF